MRRERWRPVVGHVGYEVSDHGRVRSWRGPFGKTRKTPRMRALQPSKRGGYLNVLVIENGKPILRKVHQLVLEAFVGPRPPGMLTRHKDRDVTNNRLGNLAWGTGVENEADMVRHGTHTRGERNGGAKLTQKQAEEIRVRLARGERGVDLAVEHCVSQATICRVKKGIRYGSAA